MSRSTPHDFCEMPFKSAADILPAPGTVRSITNFGMASSWVKAATINRNRRVSRSSPAGARHASVRAASSALGRRIHRAAAPHPWRAEPVHAHAEALGPESRAEGHEGLPTVGERFELLPGFLGRVVEQRERK